MLFGHKYINIPLVVIILWTTILQYNITFQIECSLDFTVIRNQEDNE